MGIGQQEARHIGKDVQADDRGGGKQFRKFRFARRGQIAFKVLFQELAKPCMSRISSSLISIKSFDMGVLFIT